MDFLNNISQNSTVRYLLIVLSFIVIFILLAGIYRFIIRKWQARARKSKSNIDDAIIRLFRVPGVWAIFAILMNVFGSFLKENERVYSIYQKISEILLVLTVGWLIIQVTRGLFHQLQKRLDITTTNNLEARKKLTQISMVERIVIITIAFIFVSIALMTIESIRELGVSLLASAGVAGIILGFAAQKSFGQVFSGIQIAFTQPIRIDDVVVIEGEWGRIEEINITYAVVKIWDQRRLIVPIEYFLNNPVQNWTRKESEILGTAMLYVSYDLPVDPLREELARLVKDNPDWDGRVQNIQVTDSKQWYKELRILVSSSDSGKNWDLRVFVREKLIDFINKHYPGSFAKISSAESPGHVNEE
jgi:small-conductance mechanosensitive channel